MGELKFERALESWEIAKLSEMLMDKWKGKKPLIMSHDISSLIKEMCQTCQPKLNGYFIRREPEYPCVICVKNNEVKVYGIESDYPASSGTCLNCNAPCSGRK